VHRHAEPNLDSQQGQSPLTFESRDRLRAEKQRMTLTGQLDWNLA